MSLIAFVGVVSLGFVSRSARADGDVKACAQILELVKMRARGGTEWTAGSLATGLRGLIEAARAPGRMHEEARVYSTSARAWAAPPQTAVVDGDVLGSHLSFDREALLDVMNRHPGGILIHTHPDGVHVHQAHALRVKLGGPADEYLHILNSLPSFKDVKLATLLTVRGRFVPGFWIVSPRYVLSVVIDPARPHTDGAHGEVFRDLLGQIDLVTQRGRSFDVGDVLRVVNQRWPAVRVRVVARLKAEGK